MNEFNTPYQPIYTPLTKEPANPAPNPAPPKTRTFTAVESVFAWISLIAGYIFCRVFPVKDNPFGGFVFIVSLFIITTVILKFKGAKFHAMPILTSVFAIIISAALIISANEFLYFFAYTFALAAYCYFIYANMGNSVKKGFSDLILADYIKALFVMPFCSMGQLFKGLFPSNGKSKGKFILKLLIGIGLAIIPTSIVLVLLSYDKNFSAIIKNIFNFSFADIFSHFISWGFAIPIGMYVFGLFISSAYKKCNDVLTEEVCSNISGKIKIAPAITVLAAVIPLICIYIIFFISQWKYYVSGFTGVLPDEFSYAEYAREGFFQLCAVSVINLIIIIMTVLFMRCKNGRPPVLLKILSVIFSVFTLILISTAISKMVMYIDIYGLTQKRVYATWLMAVLAIIFILIALKQFIPKLNAAAASIFVCVVLFAVLSLSNVDALIARYNVNRYINGSLESVDVDALEDLGDAAIPEMVRLAEVLEDTDDKELYEDVNNKLFKAAARFENDDKGIWSYTLPYIRAEKALKNMGIISD